MKTRKRILYLDLIVQALLILPCWFVFFYSLLTFDTEYLMLPMLAQLIIGPWQLISCILLAILYESKWRKESLYYTGIWLISTIGLFTSIHFLETYEVLYGFGWLVFLMLFPQALILRYFKNTYTELIKVLSTPRSFWEL